MSSSTLNKPKIKDQFELDIDRLSFHGGRGVGRHNNFVVFTPYTAPGDRALIEITEVKKNFAVAKLLEIINPSQFRQEAPCEYFQLCGGCSLQHVKYQTQIEEKQNILSKTFQSLDGFDSKKLAPFKTSPKELYYRSRVKLKIKNNIYGYFQSNSHNFVPINKCLIAHEELQQKINSGPGKNNKLTEEELSRKSAQGYFSQVNEDQNNYLISLIENFLAEKPNYTEIYDFYCGSGNFTFPISKISTEQVRVLGIEKSPKAIESAKKQDQTNKIEFICSDVKKYILNLKSHKESLFIFDPPRSGLNQSILKKTLEHEPKSIIYISCNPTTMVRDLKLLLGSPAKYEAQFLQGIDMFPQTSHIECICILTRK
jgi:23S rRNA (uracil1939-C5)-methyltransferase